MNDNSGPPPIESLDEIMTRAEVAEYLKVSEHTVDNWRYGRGAARGVSLPYFRIGGVTYVWKGGIIWWLNRVSELPDVYHSDRMRRIQAGIKVAPRKND